MDLSLAVTQNGCLPVGNEGRLAGRDVLLARERGRIAGILGFRVRLSEDLGADGEGEDGLVNATNFE